ncbi:mechanosensitive ion channel family protein [Idiomarina aquatica]|jgi:miniconductance mechanosensitive channel|uniref:Mechanosensing system component YbdG n=1 Tax=Idiomarina aquatica TaxID=1327752 RepID=A0AA94JCT0_9GAMM|nr:mechanosensitive ion channel domain-containing protein [Idiomarina aquatica]RUO42470.1 mechanosensitive ion channel protein MscS [Idiomarina aquatica]
MNYPQWFTDWANQHNWAYTATALTILIVAVWFSQLVTKHILLRGIARLLSRTELGSDPSVGLKLIVGRIAQVVPALVLSAGIAYVPDIPDTLVSIIRNVAIAYIVLTLARAFSAAMTSANEIYMRRPDSHLKPIKGYLQIAQIVVYVIAAVLIIAALIDKSPVILLSGIGAMGAVTLLVFQDTILSFVASIQLSSNDMIRVGDWIEMPQLNADGEVIDMALHTVRVQNWDKTITTIPTKRLISDSFKNWRGMQDSGGRRIKRSLFIDQTSIDFLSEAQIQSLKKLSLLGDYLDSKQAEIDDWNRALIAQGKDPMNTRQLTNIGTFRAYVLNYLKHHPKIHQGMTLMVRQLSPTPQGLPLEVYCFTNDIRWEVYEGIQSDLFDHLYAVLSRFDLHVFQETSGQDIRASIAALSGSGIER